MSLVLAMAVATLLSMLIGELVPKNMAIALSFPIGKAVARPQLVFTAIFKPAIVVLNGFSNKVLNVFGLEAKEEISGARTPAELASLVRRSAAMGTLDAGTANFIARTLKFSGRTAADVMTPRIRVETIDADQPVSDIVEAAKRTGYSRFPVIGESSDDIRGVVHIKKAIAVPADRRAKLEAGAIMTDVLRVPETIHLDALLAELREGNLQLAVVLDEYGGTAGIATLEDLVEEIVGEVADEHDKVRPGLLQSASGDWYFPGLLRPDELSEQIPGLTVPDEAAYETVGGYVMSQLGRIAAVGDTVDVGGGTLSVTRMDGRRIDRICFRPVRGVRRRPARRARQVPHERLGRNPLACRPAGRQRLLRGRRVRRHVGPPQPDRAAGRGRFQARPDHPAGHGKRLPDARLRPAGHHRLLAADPAGGRAGDPPPAGRAAGSGRASPMEVADIVAFAVALLVVTFLHVTFGEMVPKNISVSVADKAALLLAPPLMFIARLVKPVIVALNWSANHILKLMRIEPKDEVTSSFTLEEVQSIVQESTRHGLVDDDAGLITGALEFSEHTASRVMVPLDKLVMLKAATTPVEFEKAVSRTGFSRFPMLDDDGMLSGYLHIKDVLSIPDAGYHQPIAESRIRSLANLAMDDEIEKAMSVMQRTGSHLARVIGPDGLTQGVLFLEDVIEQLVGEIRDATQATGYRRLGQPDGQLTAAVEHGPGTAVHAAYP